MNILLFALAAIVILVAAFLFANRPQLVTIDASVAADFPQTGFSHASFEVLLRKYVDADGNVAYARWHANAKDRETLDQYLAAVSRFSPERTPGRFPQRSDALAYWLYSYNGYVIRSVLHAWPIASVTDVKAPIEVVKGLGFFYRQRFVFGGEAVSLYAVEHDKILANYRDPRIHFVLNCASASCPVLRPELPTGRGLEELLTSSTSDFVNDERNVRVDHEQRRIVLSTIFKWYKNDFLNDLRRRGTAAENGVIDYLLEASSPRLRDDLLASMDYEVVFEDYDWSLNDAPSSAH